MPNMPTPLDQYRPDKEVANLIRQKTGQGSVRMLRDWRRRRIGPAFVKIGKAVLYTDEAVAAWLRSQMQEPVRSRRAT
jgi:hypothetical protein